jgi:diguanylate cyclase (GGDEF)-like protein
MIYFLEYDGIGRMWAGTQHGVDVWDGARWAHYDMNDGLVWDDCDTNGFAQGPDGAIRIGTSGGLSRFTPRPDSSATTPLEVVITRLAIGKNDVSGLRNPSFDSHASSLIAQFSALNASRQNSVVFRYRLGGVASNWTETAQRELQFANLAPGAYRLEIDAREGDGEWTVRSAEFPFRILAPWYLTWWFATLCALVPLSVVAAALRLRFLGAKRRERELVLLVEEKTADLQQANEELSRLSFTDPLTGLANRRVFDQTLDRECARMDRTGSAVSLLSIDADHFKAINDSHGHQRGDEYLVALGAELTRLCRRQVDLAARCGGEEFAIILPETSASNAERFAESVRLAIADLQLPHPTSPVASVLTVSVGVATAKQEGWCTREGLVAAADRALYAAKKAGRNRVCAAPWEADAEAVDEVETGRARASVDFPLLRLPGWAG